MLCARQGFGHIGIAVPDVYGESACKTPPERMIALLPSSKLDPGLDTHASERRCCV